MTQPPRLSLLLLPELFAICRLPAGAAIPDWPASGTFVSITRTADEVSIVCPAACVRSGVKADLGWRCLQVEGPFDFDATGVIATLAAPLAAARISILPIGTYDTDYFLLKDRSLPEAIQALRQAGHQAHE